MAYCVPLGIPHSTFLSWDPDDQDKALAYLRAKDEICIECGTRESEWEGDREAFISDIRRCLGCELLAMERENVEPDQSHGVKYFLRRNPVPKEERQE